MNLRGHDGQNKPSLIPTIHKSLQLYMMYRITMIGVKRDDFGFQRPKQVGMSRNNTQNSSLWSLSVKFKITLETIKTIKPLKSNINVKTQRVSDLFASGVKHNNNRLFRNVDVNVVEICLECVSTWCCCCCC